MIEKDTDLKRYHNHISIQSRFNTISSLQEHYTQACKIEKKRKLTPLELI